MLCVSRILDVSSMVLPNYIYMVRHGVVTNVLRGGDKDDRACI